MACRAVIDKQSCQSSQRCALAEPDGFGLDSDQLGAVLPGAARLPRERLVEIARDCPGLAIAVYDEDDVEIDLE